MAPSSAGTWIYFTSHRSGAWQIWRMPAAGGEPERVTTAGGYSALEGPHGEFVYYAKYGQNGLWRLPLDGSGAEQQVYPYLSILDWGSWLVRPEGIYGFNHDPPSVVLYKTDTGEFVPVVPLSGSIPRQTPALSLSADGSLLIWAQVDMQEDDIYLAEGVGR